MTLPMNLPRVAADQAGAPTPNAPTSVSGGTPQEADGIAAPFAAVLTLVLAQAAPAIAVDPPAAGEGEAPEADASSSLLGQSELLPDPATARPELPAGEAPRPASPPIIQAVSDAVADTVAAAVVTGAAALLEAPPAAPAAPAPPTRSTGTAAATRSLDALAPEFRQRLERVIDRMETEFGYKVEVVETFRSQPRQNALYAQGRTEPGPVVTWTQASNHTAGRAADLVVDGSYADAVPYERLMRIAREEGLRTLGPRDPGHVELQSTPSVAAARTVLPNGANQSLSYPPATVIARAAPSVAAQPSIVPAGAELQSRASAVATAASIPAPQTRRVAPVASVARVAGVAPVADVARVAQVGVVSGSARVSATGGITAERRVTASSGSLAEPIDAGRERAPASSEAAREAAAEVLRQSRDGLIQTVGGAESGGTSSSSGSAAPVDGLERVDMSERIARLLKVQDAAGDRPLSQVMLRLERPDGGEDRVRVDLRGSTVTATLDVGDQAAADRLGANVQELQRALERHGFDTDALTFRTASRAAESSTLARAAGAAAETELQRAAASSPSNTSSNTSSNTPSRDRGARHDEQRPSPDSQRQRSRREQKGDR